MINIYTYPGNIVLTPCKEVFHLPSNEIDELIEDLKISMEEREGMGMAANQLGVDKQVFVMKKEDQEEPIVCINPRIIEASKEMESDQEGCFSLPGFAEFVPRHKKISVFYRHPTGDSATETLVGMDARVFQHEYDHVMGKTFLDRVSPLKRSIIAKKLNKYIGQGTWPERI